MLKSKFAVFLHWFPVEQAESDFHLAGAPNKNELKFFERLSQNERVVRLLEKLKTLVKEGDKEYNPGDKQMDETEDLLKTITMRTKTSTFFTKNEHSKTLDKRDAMTMAKKKHFSD